MQNSVVVSELVSNNDNENKSRVSNQNGVSQLYIIVEKCHSGLKTLK